MRDILALGELAFLECLVQREKLTKTGMSGTTSERRRLRSPSPRRITPTMGKEEADGRGG